MSEPWGAIEYKGPGYFIAGGAGITPFIAIFRHLRREQLVSGNKLFFSNKTDKDIILADELKFILGDNVPSQLLVRKTAAMINAESMKHF